MCKTCKKSLLDVENVILIRYYYYTVKTRALYESTDEQAGQPADNRPNSDGLWDVHQTVPELMVLVDWWPGPPMWKRVGSDPHPDPKCRSGTVANTNPHRQLKAKDTRMTCHFGLNTWLWQKLPNVHGCLEGHHCPVTYLQGNSADTCAHRRQPAFEPIASPTIFRSFRCRFFHWLHCFRGCSCPWASIHPRHHQVSSSWGLNHVW